MSKDITNDISRRKCLQTISSVGIAGTGIGVSSGSVAANRNPGFDTDQVLSTPPLENLIAEFNSVEFIDETPDGESTALDERSELTLTVFELPVRLNWERGTIKYGIFARNGEIKARRATVELDDLEQKTVPDQYSKRASKVKSILVGTKDGTEFFRAATDAEKAHLANVIGEKPEKISAVTGDRISGFNVIETGRPQVSVQDSSTGSSSPRKYHVNVDTTASFQTPSLISSSEDATAATGLHDSSSDYQAQSSCDEVCFKCLQIVGISTGCYTACGALMASGTGSLAAWIVCYECLSLSGGMIGWTCGKCLGCIGL